MDDFSHLFEAENQHQLFLKNKPKKRSQNQQDFETFLKPSVEAI